MPPQQRLKRILEHLALTPSACQLTYHDSLLDKHVLPQANYPQPAIVKNDYYSRGGYTSKLPPQTFAPPPEVKCFGTVENSAAAIEMAFSSMLRQQQAGVQK